MLSFQRAEDVPADKPRGETIMGCASPLWEVPGLSTAVGYCTSRFKWPEFTQLYLPIGPSSFMPMDVVMPKHLPETLPTPVRCLRNFHAYVWGTSVTAGAREPRAER
jgi:hypothetical protein